VQLKHLLKPFQQWYNLEFHVTFLFQTSWNFSSDQYRWVLMWDTWRYSNNTTQACILKRAYMQSKGAISKFRLGLISIGLTLASSSPLNLSCLSSNPLLNGWQTPGVLHGRHHRSRLCYL
jgi:hypothetical protein